MQTISIKDKPVDNDPILETFEELLKLLGEEKENSLCAEARRLAIVITETEKALAYYWYYVL